MLLVVVLCLSFSIISCDLQLDLFKTEIDGVFQNHSKPLLLRKFLPTERFFRKTVTPKNVIFCSICDYIFNQAIKYRKQGTTKQELEEFLINLCINLKIETTRVCRGVIESNSDILLYIVDNTPKITGNKICGSLLQAYGCPPKSKNSPIIIPPKTEIKENLKLEESQLKILHISDIHYDPNYLPYGNALCGEPLCCQQDQSLNTSTLNSCGYWTDYRDADTSKHFLQEVIKHLKTQDFDFVYFTGDVISHRIWDTSPEENQKSILEVYNFLKQLDVRVFPIFGNHEPHPLNLWTPSKLRNESFSMNWLYELAGDLWSDLIGEDIRETVLKGGYYTISLKRGLRLVALNSNICYNLNFWLIYDDSDLFQQLNWLVATLQEAEIQNEKVHILSHIPSGSSECYQSWEIEFNKIIKRFSKIIVGQFNGHTHWDEFRVFYSGITPVGVAFNGASLTPYSWSNPSYKIYQLTTNYTLLDYDEWIFDLNSSNNETIEWYKLYSFRNAYGVKNLEPQEIDSVLYKMVENRSLLQDFYRYKYRNSIHMMKINCDFNCENENLCQLVTTVSGDDSNCRRFLQKFKETNVASASFQSLLLLILIIIFKILVRF